MKQTRKEFPVSKSVNQFLVDYANKMPKPDNTLMYDTIFNNVVRKDLTKPESQDTF